MHRAEAERRNRWHQQSRSGSWRINQFTGLPSYRRAQLSGVSGWEEKKGAKLCRLQMTDASFIFSDPDTPDTPASPLARFANASAGEAIVTDTPDDHGAIFKWR